MSDSGEPKPPLLPALREVVRENRNALTDHPDISDLQAYCEGRLTGTPLERLKDHLALCPECAALFLDLKAFVNDATHEGRRPESEARVESAWWQIQGRLGEEAPQEERARAVPPAPVTSMEAHRTRTRPDESPKTPSWRAPFSLIAAALLLGVVGLSTWSALRPGAELPQYNVGLTDETKFLLGVRQRRSAPGIQRGVEPWPLGQVETIPAGEETSLGLSLPQGVPPFAHYELAIVKKGEDEPLFPRAGVELISGLERGSGDGFTLSLPSELLSPGIYEIQVYGQDSEVSWEPVASYSIQVIP